MDAEDERRRIIDHQVGTGKTLIMCIAAFEMKRLGLANKPMSIGLKSTIFFKLRYFEDFFDLCVSNI